MTTFNQYSVTQYHLDIKGAPFFVLDFVDLLESYPEEWSATFETAVFNTVKERDAAVEVFEKLLMTEYGEDYELYWSDTANRQQNAKRLIDDQTAGLVKFDESIAKKLESML